MRISLIFILLIITSCSQKKELNKNETLLFGQVLAKEGRFEKGYIKYYRPYLPTSDYKIVHLDSTGKFNFIIDEPDVYKFEFNGNNLDKKEIFVDLFEDDTLAFNVELGKVPFPKDSLIELILERDGGYNMSSPIKLKKLSSGFAIKINNMPTTKKVQRYIISYSPIEGLLDESGKRFYVDSIDVVDQSIFFHIPYSKFTFGLPQSTLSNIKNAEYIVANQKMIEFFRQGYNEVIKEKGTIKDFNENGIVAVLDYAEYLISQMYDINNKLIFGADLHSQLNMFTNRFRTYHNSAMDLIINDEVFAARVPSYLFGLPLLNYLVGDENKLFATLEEVRPFQKEALSKLDNVLNREISNSKRLKLLVIKYKNYGSIKKDLALHTLEEIIALFPYSSEAVEARKQIALIRKAEDNRKLMEEELKEDIRQTELAKKKKDELKNPDELKKDKAKQ